MGNMDSLIFRRFRIRSGDTLPFKSYKKTRDDLAKIFGEFGFKTGAEVGVQAGIYSKILCDSIPGLKLKCIDPWGAFGGTSAEKSEKYYQIALRTLSPYDVEFIRKPSLEAVLDVPDKSLDFVYIDELHEFDHVVMDLILWGKKVREGGIFAGHDYSNNYYQYGVIPAVDTYTRAHNIMRWYITNEQRDPSYFWVKR